MASARTVARDCELDEERVRLLARRTHYDEHIPLVSEVLDRRANKEPHNPHPRTDGRIRAFIFDITVSLAQRHEETTAGLPTAAGC
jgi:hypothetical protein